MFKADRLRYMMLSLIVVISACGVPGTVSPTPRELEEASPTRAAQTESAAASGLAVPVESTPTQSGVAQEPTAAATRAKPVENTRVEKLEANVEATPEESAISNTEDGPSEQQLRLLASLQSRGPAPELPNDAWLNSEALRLADLQGKVVLVEFWTFG